MSTPPIPPVAEPPCEYGARCTPDDPCGLHEAQAAPPWDAVAIPPSTSTPVGGVVTDPYADVPLMARAFSAYLDASYPAEVGTEARLWRRITKVDEETGEVQEALRAYLGENPRKPRGPISDVVKELCDVAACAMGALEHVTGNQGASLALIADRLRFTCERAGVEYTAGGAS